MFVFRDYLLPADIENIGYIVSRTQVFSAEEIKIAQELVQEALEFGAAKTGYHFLMLEDSDKTVAGYACYGRIPLTEDSFDLYWIAIAPEYQGQGGASALLNEVKRRTINMGGARLYAETSGRPDYAAAHHMYEKAGFTLAARLKDFYRAGDDKLIEFYPLK